MNEKIILACETCSLRDNGGLCSVVTEVIIGAVVRANPTTDISGVRPRSETAQNLLTGFASAKVAQEAGKAACVRAVGVTAN